jgi:Domain of unknown function (DUF4286)
MLSYEVTIQLDDPSLANALESYMRGGHLAAVLATGCFLDGRFEQSAPDVYRTRYSVASQQDLDRYVEEHAPRLRADFQEHFPSGLKVTRAIWSEM